MNILLSSIRKYVILKIKDGSSFVEKKNEYNVILEEQQQIQMLPIST